jgi:L-fuconolactonase
MIIDTHHHLWKYNPDDYGWMDESMGVLKKDYLPPDLEDEIVKAGVSGTVVVQARQRIEETSWLLDLAERTPFIKGVVGWFDLQSEKIGEQLDQYAAHPKLVGARHVIHDEPDDDFMFRPAFLRGLELLQNYNLSYDLLLFPKHLKSATELVRLLPDQTFILDHISKPPVSSGILQPWKDEIEALASRSNVWCKISGMVTEADHNRWRYEEFVPYLNTVLSAFGRERIMLGSDWPVCRLAGEYKEIMDIPLRYIENLNEDDKIRIYRQNAIECYQLED